MQGQGGLDLTSYDTMDRRQLCRAHLLSALQSLQAAHAIAERIADEGETKVPSLIYDARGLTSSAITQMPLAIDNVAAERARGAIQS